MALNEPLLREWDEEMKITRRVIERVPSEKGEWKPHVKSFSMAHLTQLTATMPGWVTRIMKGQDIDLGHSDPYKTQPTASLLEQFDKHVKESRAAIESARDEDFGKPWSLTMGGRTLLTLPRGVILRQTINHLVHHRGQMTVYLRLLDVPVPSVYGPTADERMF